MRPNISKAIKRSLLGLLAVLGLSTPGWTYTLEDYSLVGTGNLNGFSSEFFSLTASEPITTSGGGTSSSTMDLTFSNLSSTSIESLLVTFEGMASSTIIDGNQWIETSPGSGVYLISVDYGGLESGGQLTTSLSLTANGNSSEGQITAAKISIYTIPALEGPVVATPEPPFYALLLVAYFFFRSRFKGKDLAHAP